jgi:hypothetical protein
MRLRTPGELQEAIDNVDLLAQKLTDCLNGFRHTAQWTSEAWLKWWAEADMKLRELFAEDNLLAPLAQTATEIRNLDIRAPVLEAPIVSLVVRERDVWVDRLRGASEKLRQLKDFVMRPGRVAVLDTSAFQEFERFWKADWAKVAGADPPHVSKPGLPIRLVVPLLVVEELDGQKRHPNGRVRQTARETLRHLRELPRISTDAVANVLRLDDRVTMEIFLDDPTHTRLPVNDAEIIDRAVELRSLFPVSRRLILVSGDVSMEFRAEGMGLKARHVARDVADGEEPEES